MACSQGCRVRWLLLSLVLIAAAPVVAQTGPEGPLAWPASREEFKRLYSEWRQKLGPVWVRSDYGWQYDFPEYLHMVGMGVAALPYVMEEIRGDRQALILWNMINYLTRTERRRIFPPRDSELSMEENDDRERLALLEWWEGGAERAKQQCDAAVEKWHQLRDPKDRMIILFSTDTVLSTDGQLSTLEKRETPAGKAYGELCELGVPILPFLMERIAAGDVDLLPAFEKIAHRSWPTSDFRQESVPDAKKWWEENRSRWLIPWPEKPAQPPRSP